MSERKVLNKYFPPDFDPSKLQKIKRQKDKQDNVRMMLPMSVRCNTCGNFLYIGTKFNMRKETCSDEEYLGIKIFRFYFKCSRCYSEITMKTDPKNHDYVCEHGASRNYEPWRDIQHAETVLRTKRQLEDSDAMKSLENRTYDSKREMDVLDALEEVRHMNRRLAKVNHEELLLKTLSKYEDEEDKKFDNEIKESFEQRKKQIMHQRLQDDQIYEDGDNFDSHIGFLNIMNPYDLLTKQIDEFGISNMDSSSSDSEPEQDNISQEFKKPSALTSKLVSAFGIKKKDTMQREKSDDAKFNDLFTFKKPIRKMPPVQSQIVEKEVSAKQNILAGIISAYKDSDSSSSSSSEDEKAEV